MYQFSGRQQTGTTKFAVVSLKLKKSARPRFNETKTDTENGSNWNDFGWRVKSKSKFNENTMFLVALQNLGLYFNPKTKDNVDLRFYEII